MHGGRDIEYGREALDGELHLPLRPGGVPAREQVLPAGVIEAMHAHLVARVAHVRMIAPARRAMSGAGSTVPYSRVFRP